MNFSEKENKRMINEVVAFNCRVGPKGPALVRFLVIKKKKKKTYSCFYFYRS